MQNYAVATHLMRLFRPAVALTVTWATSGLGGLWVWSGCARSADFLRGKCLVFYYHTAADGVGFARPNALVPHTLAYRAQYSIYPFIVATLVSIAAAWAQWQPPEVIDKLLSSLAASAAPAALFAMGVTAALRPLKRVPIEAVYLVPIKLILHPLLAYSLLSLIPDLPQVWLLTAVWRLCPLQLMCLCWRNNMGVGSSGRLVLW